MKKKLLLADDSVTIQKVVKLTFAGEDIVIEAVTSGDLVLDRVREFKPDIVLADVLMPGRNGYDVCASIKSDPALAKTPVILIVGTFEPFDEDRALRVKCDAWLTKPFDASELVRVVDSLIGRARSAANEPAGSLRGKGGDSAREAKMEDVNYLESTVPPEHRSVRLVSDRTRESFVGSGRILDLFASGKTAVIGAPAARPPASSSSVAAEKTTRPGSAGTGTETSVPELSEEAIDLIVERVIRKMSNEVVREVAWEVVPEMSELIIRQCLEEKGKI
jgi:CheY-like chemotaxis protein